jgi:hypothetical protein
MRLNLSELLGKPVKYKAPAKEKVMGEHDLIPGVCEGRPECDNESSEKELVCTRKAGHLGLHHGSDGERCLGSWK